jgi:hypothetical protein
MFSLCANDLPDTASVITDEDMERLQKVRKECVSLLTGQQVQANRLNDMIEALREELPSPYSSLLTQSWRTPSTSGYTPSLSPDYSPLSALGNDASPTKPKILEFGNRKYRNADHSIVFESHQQKRLANQADQSWAACLIQEQEASQACGPLRTQ